VNADENPETAVAAGVASMPTLNADKGGKIVKTIVGAKPKPVLLRELAEFLG